MTILEFLFHFTHKYVKYTDNIFLYKVKSIRALRPWISQTTWPNSCEISCKITFLFHRIYCWKFGKYKRRRLKTSVNFVWVNICQKWFLLPFSNFQKDVFLIMILILHERINVKCSHVVRLTHGLNKQYYFYGHQKPINFFNY